MKIIIRLNNQFYSKSAVESTIEAFKDICHGELMSDDFDIELESAQDIANLKEEFANYVLGLMK